MYVSFDTECAQNLENREGSFAEIANLIYGKQICSKCETVDDLYVDCEQYGKRVHVFRQDPVGKFIPYLQQSRSFADKVHVISHNSRAYVAQFLLRRIVELRWVQQLKMDGSKILSMFVENLHFLDALNYLPISLKSVPKSFDLACKKDYYPHFFKTANNLDYVGLYPEPKIYGQTLCHVMSEPNFRPGMRG